MSRIRRSGAIALALATVALCNPAPQPTLKVRLQTPLTSYSSHPGSRFQSVVIAPYETGGRVVMPPGTIVYGIVHRARAVGLGLIHERAWLEIEFREYQLPDGRRFPLTGKLRHIDNARETVEKNGRIKGILAASSPQSFVRGIWHRPDLELFQRSFLGLTGAPGRVWSDFSLGPFGAAALFFGRCALFRMPEPEIQLPAGTEMRIAVNPLPEDAPSFAQAPAGHVAPEFAEWAARQPFELTRASGRAAEDLVNVALIGSGEQMIRAFQAAGWSEAEPLTTRSFSRAFRAYTGQTGYASAPASKLLYEEAEPVFVFEKSLNTIAKRHHVRIWRVENDGVEVWLGAATHDIGIGFTPATMSFTHKIQSHIDWERSKIVNDLAFAGCGDPAAYVERPDAIRDRADVNSDGRLAVIRLRDCSGDDPPAMATPRSPKPWPMRIARRMILEGRQYVLRGNLYYWGYRALRWKRTSPAEMAAIE
jgi:hypothetical protein